MRARTLRMWSVMAAILVAASRSWSVEVVLVYEGFENGGSMPSGWAAEEVVPGNNLTFVTNTDNPSGFAANSGTYCVRFNSYTADGGVIRLMTTNPVGTIGYTNIAVSFYWLYSSGYASSNDAVDVQWSTNGIVWYTAGSFLRYNATPWWSWQRQILPAGAEGRTALYLGLRFRSAYGMNCFLDGAAMSGVTAHWYAGAQDAGSGWLHVPWFGYFKEGGGNWIYGLEHGWLLSPSTYSDSIWFWSASRGWLWTNASLYYTWFWSDPLHAWLWYSSGSGHGSGGWFYNFGTGHWVWM